MHNSALYFEISLFAYVTVHSYAIDVYSTE